MRNLLSRLVALALIIIALGCGAMRSAGEVAKWSLIDCTKAQTAKVVGELRPLMGTVIAHAVNGSGKLDYAPVKDFAKGFASDVTRCAVADAVARLINPPPADPNAPQLSPLQVDRDAAIAGLRELFGGQRFRTAAGDI